MQYKPDSFELSLIETPVVSTEALFTLNDFAGEMTTKIDQEKKDILDQICIKLQGLDRDIGSYVQSFQDDGCLSSEEALVVMSYFLISRQTGPESNELRDMFYYGVSTVAQFSEKVSGIKMPTNIARLLVSTYQKAYGSTEEGVRN